MIGLYTNEKEVGVVYSYDMLWSKTFSPFSASLVLDKVNGRTYAEKKEFVRDRAITYSHWYDVPQNIADIMEIEAWFYKYGRRYGLLKEFHENGIC